MNTSDLPQAIKKLKLELKEKILAFNKETGLNISGVLIEAEMETIKSIDLDVVKNYHIGINVEL